MFDWPGRLAILLTLLPPALRLFRTRSLLRHVDDPALPERLARRHLAGFAFGMVASLEIILWPRYALGTIPLLIVLFALAGWPLRRALFSETWSFPSYLWFYVRLVLAIYGFWILLVAAPFLVDLNDRRAWGLRRFLASSCSSGTNTTAACCGSSCARSRSPRRRSSIDSAPSSRRLRSQRRTWSTSTCAAERSSTRSRCRT